MSTLLRCWSAGLAVVIVLFSAFPVSAQEAPSTFEQCKLRTMDAIIAHNLVDSGKVEDDLRYSFIDAKGTNQDDVEAIKKKYPQQWESEKKKVENRPSLLRFASNAWHNANCSLALPVEAAVNKVKDSGFWDDPIGKFTKSVIEGNAESLNMAMTFWMDFDTSSVNTAASVQGVKNIVMGLSGFALMASFIIGGYRLAAARRGGLQQGLEETQDNMIRWLIFSIAVPAMIPGALIASDALAKAIMENFGATSPAQMVNLAGIEETKFGPIFTLALVLVSLVGSIIQIVALAMRTLLLPIVTGLTPLFAALSFSETGRNGLNHLVGWIIAGIVFKPVSALLYAVVLWNVTKESDIGLSGAILNALMIGLAGFCAPALVRTIVPAVAQAGGGGAAPLLAGATGAIGAGMGASLGSIGGGASKLGHQMSSAGSGAQMSAGGGKAAPLGGATGAGPRTGGGNGATSPSGSRPAGGNTRGSGVASGALRAGGRAASAVGASAAVVGQVAAKAGRVGTGAAYTSQRVFDESLGASGQYAGQVAR
ncbi:hypothetical protein ACP8NE_03350 [Corynebacterium ulcerans]|uniref:hypothetical protein n=1 Tax=Corynebacterium ulcerans TaxID=65058 RepID=UPI003D6DCA71